MARGARALRRPHIVNRVGKLDWDDALPAHPQQQRFVWSCARNNYFLGGVGTGKTVGLCDRSIRKSLARPAGQMGCFFARTGRDLIDVILPTFMERVDLLQENTGQTHLKSWRASDKEIRWMSGATTIFRPMEDVDKYRGLNLVDADADEIEFVRGDPLYTFQTLNARLRRGAPNLRSFDIACSPNGNRGVIRQFMQKVRAGSRNYRVFNATMFDNPFLFELEDCAECGGTGCGLCGGVGLESEYIATQRGGMSDRQWRQEGLGEVLMPLTAVFGDEFSPEQHEIDWTWDRRLPWVLCIDWGEAQGAVFCACQVLPEPMKLADGRILPAGSWVVAAERRLDMVSRNQFRHAIMDFISKGKLGDSKVLPGGSPGRPSWIATDRAVKAENAWIRRQYSDSGVQIRNCETREQQRVRNGVGMIGYMLAPAEGPPRLYLSKSLADPGGKVVGMRESMREHKYVLDWRTNLPTDVYSDDTYKHIIDALRYAVVTSARHAPLHGGAPLPYTQRYADGA